MYLWFGLAFSWFIFLLRFWLLSLHLCVCRHMSNKSYSFYHLQGHTHTHKKMANTATISYTQQFAVSILWWYLSSYLLPMCNSHIFVLPKIERNPMQYRRDMCSIVKRGKNAHRWAQVVDFLFVFLFFFFFRAMFSRWITWRKKNESDKTCSIDSQVEFKSTKMLSKDFTSNESIRSKRSN